jgi:hypothetical protein
MDSHYQIWNYNCLKLIAIDTAGLLLGSFKSLVSSRVPKDLHCIDSDNAIGVEIWGDMSLLAPHTIHCSIAKLTRSFK